MSVAQQPPDQRRYKMYQLQIYLFLTYLSLLTLLQLLVGIVLILLWKRLSGTEPKIRKSGRFGVITDLGQRKQAADSGVPNNITQEEMEWAREEGASTDDEIQDLIAQHKQEVGR